MSNSPLASYTKISPNNGGYRKSKINTITPHCVVGQLSVETLGEWFAKESTEASSNYGIGTDGRIAVYVDENKRSWCSSNSTNDDKAVTIECASDTKHPYTMNEKVWASLLDLCTDICIRNGKNKLVWISDKTKALSYDLGDNEMLITVHRWFDTKECPGEWLYNRLGQVAELVNHRLNDASTIVDVNRITPFTVEVTKAGVPYRLAASPTAKQLGTTGKGIFTIVEVSSGWGKLKSGAGWIYLNDQSIKIRESIIKLTDSQKDRISAKLEEKWWKKYQGVASNVLNNKYSNVKAGVEADGCDYDVIKIIVDEMRGM